MDGFKTLRRTGVAVSGGDRVPFRHWSIEVGGTAETVNVTRGSRADPVAERRAFLHRRRPKRSQNLPVGPRRNFASLTALTPGVQVAERRHDRHAARRRRPEQHHDGRRLGDGHRQQRPDAADERRGDCARSRVLTQGYQAEYGRSSGLQITAVTKSGTNQFRGSVYDVDPQLRLELRTAGSNQKNGMPKPVVEREGLWATRWAGRSASRAATTSCSSSTATSTARRQRRSTTATSSASRPRSSAPGDFSQTLDNNGAPFNLIRNAAAACRARPAISAAAMRTAASSGASRRARSIRPGSNILKLYRAERQRRPGADYNYEVAAADGEHLIQQPAIRLDYQVSSKLRARPASTRASAQPRPIARGTAPGGTHPRLQRRTSSRTRGSRNCRRHQSTTPERDHLHRSDLRLEPESARGGAIA